MPRAVCVFMFVLNITCSVYLSSLSLSLLFSRSLYVAMVIFVVTYLGINAANSGSHNLIPLGGLTFFIVVGFLMSKHPDRVSNLLSHPRLSSVLYSSLINTLGPVPQTLLYLTYVVKGTDTLYHRSGNNITLCILVRTL